MSGSEQQDKEILDYKTKKLGMVYCVILASRYQELLERETRDKKHGKSRKLNKLDKNRIADVVTEANQQFESQHFHKELERRRAEFVQAQMEAAEKRKEQEQKPEEQVVAQVAASVLEEKQPEVTVVTASVVAEGSPEK